MFLKSTIQPLINKLRRARAKSPLISLLRIERKNEMLYLPKMLAEPYPKINLIIIGAQKSGTTTLYKYLAAQPQIHMSNPIKEPGYFCDMKFIQHFFQAHGEYKIDSREQVYRRFMLKGYAGQAIFGEASTYYTYGERSRLQQIPQRILQECGPDVKLIYIMRDPAERMRSHYLHIIRNSNTSGDYKKVFNEVKDIMIKTSCYHYQLQPYAETFGRDNLLLLEFDELRNNRPALIRKLKDFLQLPLSDNVKLLSAANVGSNRRQFDPDALQLKPETEAWLQDVFAEDTRLLRRDYGLEPGWFKEK